MSEDVKARRLPGHITLGRHPTRPARYAGTLPIADLPRLAAAVAEPAGRLQATLDLARDPRGVLRLSGQVEATLRLTCQRCLAPFDWPLRIPVALRCVFSEAEEQQVLREEESYWVQDGQLPLQDLIEDEVLLALPFAARCGRPGCDGGD